MDGRRRVVIDAVRPSVDGGRFAAKRTVGDEISVEADILIDGHDLIAGIVAYRHEDEKAFTEIELGSAPNDLFRASFSAHRLGRWHFRVEAWVDAFATLVRGVERKLDAGQDIELELRGAALLLKSAVPRADAGTRDLLLHAAGQLADAKTSITERTQLALGQPLRAAMKRCPDRRWSTKSSNLSVIVEPPRARFSSWYEFFPRSARSDGKHGTFADAAERLEYVSQLGFDVVYLPPIHPIGTQFRKGRDNALKAEPGDPGSPWAIGGAAGGHTAVHPELGTIDDFRRFVARARDLGIDVALDIAFQASPDHPWVKEHPEWFVHRADGTIQYAENPPKKYQDVYPFAFDCEAWQSLWNALRDVFLFWAKEGVRVFRVDNPHTKPLPFWEWCLAEVKAKHPDAIFLAEAFTRPKLMNALAKLGFSQSYTYFTWRNTKAELTGYMNDLLRSDVAEYVRPNFWPNTPDILPEHLQFGGRPIFAQRLILAATLSSSYGIYGPAYELGEAAAHKPGGEEYASSEKYEIRTWDLDRADSLRHLIRRINDVRRENPALQRNDTLRFHRTDNDAVLAYSKTAPGSDAILVVVNLDPRHPHSCWIDLDLSALGIGPGESFQVHDLISEARYLWSNARNFVELDPRVMPAHLFRIRRKVRSEQNFEYYL